MRWLILAAALCLAAGAAYAQTVIPPTQGAVGPFPHALPWPPSPEKLAAPSYVIPRDSFGHMSRFNSDGSINVRLENYSGSGLSAGFSVGVASAMVLPFTAQGRSSLAIDNESTSYAVACNFGGTAALNTAGSWTIPAGMTRTWPAVAGGFVPSDTINCIAGAASTPISIQMR